MNLTDSEKEQIAHAFPALADAIDLYPQALYSAYEGMSLPPLKAEYLPQTVELYLAAGDVESDPAIAIVGNTVTELALDLIPDNPVTTMLSIDGNWAFVQIAQSVVLDRLGDVVLPDALVSEDTILQTLKIHLES